MFVVVDGLFVGDVCILYFDFMEGFYRGLDCYIKRWVFIFFLDKVVSVEYFNVVLFIFFFKLFFLLCIVVFFLDFEYCFEFGDFNLC